MYPRTILLVTFGALVHLETNIDLGTLVDSIDLCLSKRYMGLKGYSQFHNVYILTGTI